MRPQTRQFAWMLRATIQLSAKIVRARRVPESPASGLCSQGRRFCFRNPVSLILRPHLAKPSPDYCKVNFTFTVVSTSTGSPFSRYGR